MFPFVFALSYKMNYQSIYRILVVTIASLALILTLLYATRNTGVWERNSQLGYSKQSPWRYEKHAPHEVVRDNGNSFSSAKRYTKSDRGDDDSLLYGLDISLIQDRSTQGVGTCR